METYKGSDKQLIKVLLFSPFKAPFIEVDYEILKKIAKVDYIVSSGFKAVIQLKIAVLSNNLIICWFGSVYAALCVIYGILFRKQVVIILGGVDAAANKEFNYGIWLTKWKALLLRHTLPRAYKILVVAPSMKENIKQLANYNGANIIYVPFGFDTEFWSPAGEKQDIVLTVGSCDTETRFLKKGFDYFIETAKEFPNIPFIMIGLKKQLIRELGLDLPQNVKVVETLSQIELLQQYRKCKVFCQPSRSEGMPNTLCEAMSCGCIPVGSDVDGIPTAIKDTGFVFHDGNLNEMASAIRKGLNADSTYSKKARERIIKTFPMERRVNSLKELVLNIS